MENTNQQPNNPLQIPIPQTVVTTPQPKSGMKFKFNPKIIYIFLIAIILIEVVLAVRSFVSPTKSQALIEKPQPLGNGRIVLESDKRAYQVGDEIEVNIKISTGGYTSAGSDVLLIYDPEIVELSEGRFFERGQIYQDYPGANFDPERGSIFLSGISISNSEGFNGTDSFGKLFLKAKKTGITSLKVEYTKESTTDSNIIEIKSIADVLGEVHNLDLNIGGVGSDSIIESISCDGYVQICEKEDGNKGSQSCDGGKVKDNICVWDPIYTVSCTSCE